MVKVANKSKSHVRRVMEGDNPKSPTTSFTESIKDPESGRIVKVALSQRNESGELACLSHGAHELFCSCIALALRANADGPVVLDCWAKVVVPLFQEDRITLSVDIDPDDRSESHMKVFIREPFMDLGYVIKGEGRFVLRSIILDRMSALDDEAIARMKCQANQHNYSREEHLRSDLKERQVPFAHQLASLISTKVCLDCRRGKSSQQIAEEDLAANPF